MWYIAAWVGETGIHNMHAHTHTRTHTQTHTHTDTHTDTRTRAHTHTDTRTRAHTHTTHRHTHTHTHTHTQTHAHTHRHTDTQTHRHTDITVVIISSHTEPVLRWHRIPVWNLQIMEKEGRVWEWGLWLVVPLLLSSQPLLWVTHKAVWHKEYTCLWRQSGLSPTWASQPSSWCVFR